MSHDRALLDAVVTTILVFEGAGRIREYVGGYQDLAAPTPDHARGEPRPQAAATPCAARPETGAETAPGKLGYKDQRELQALPARIESLETEQRTLQERQADPAFYQQAGNTIAEAGARLAALEDELAQAYAR